MKAIANIAIALILATSLTACGHADDSDPVVVVTESSFDGVYEGTTTKIVSLASDFSEFDNSDIRDARVSITRSQSGDKVLINDLAEGCIIAARDEGSWLAIEHNACVVEGDELRLSVAFEGEGEFTRSGKLSLDIWGAVTLQQKVYYDHGIEWETVADGDMHLEFEGRAL